MQEFCDSFRADGQLFGWFHQVWQQVVARAGGGSAVARSNCAWIMEVLNGRLEAKNATTERDWKVRKKMQKSRR